MKNKKPKKKEVRMYFIGPIHKWPYSPIQTIKYMLNGK